MKYKIIILLTTVLIPLFGCGDTPVFTEMSTNRLKVVVKGTFETDSDQFLLLSMPADSRVIEDDSVDNVTNNDIIGGGNDTVPTTFMLDIAEVRLNGKKFANYRKIIEASLSGNEPFFNYDADGDGFGDGVVLQNDDPGEGTYETVQLYVRKMIFDNAMIYQSVGNTMTYEEPAEVVFHENDVNGFDFNQYQVNSYWDSLRMESGDILRNFPLEIPISGNLVYDKENEETVLEIRLVIKNFIKKYEHDYYDEGVFKVCHYYALSDWLRDVKAGEYDIGRNIHAVARAYVPGKTGIISGAGAGASVYVIAVPAGDVIGDYTISAPGSSLRSANFCDLPLPPSSPGAYIEAMLEYYLKYEKYKDDFNNKISTCPYFDITEGTDFPNYTDEWNTYEAAVENFRIAPYVVVSDSSGNYSFGNVAPGSYDVYRAAVPAYGELFIDGAFTLINTVTVSVP